jgi:hypothetical protein
MYVGTTNSKPPGPIIMHDQNDQSEILSDSHVQFSTFFFRCTTVLRLLQATGKLHEFGAEKPISGAKLARFDSLTDKFYCLESHIEHGWKCSKVPTRPTIHDYLLTYLSSSMLLPTFQSSRGGKKIKILEKYARFPFGLFEALEISDILKY